MFSKLTNKQKQIVHSSECRIVVKACPGSGKTYSVAARLAKLLHTQYFQHKGIAVISFTRVAGEEIKKNLRKGYDINGFGYPHFIGTIDTFINRHIFLPFGHLLLGCDSRPEIVGTEFNQWYDFDTSQRRRHNGRITYREPNEYFEKVSFNADNEPIPLAPASSYHFSWKQLKKNDGTYKKVISDIIDSKWNHFAQGKVNQADANYFALKLIKEYPSILKNLCNKYSHLIIDEAQDTTDIQMSIIDRLDESGIENVLFVGDPDQAIFEWNTADAELFIKKYNSEDYSTIELLENRRSSDNICSLLNKICSIESVSTADVKNDPNIPEVKGYESNDNVQEIKNNFIEKCNELEIELNNTAILFRGKSFGEEYFELVSDSSFDHPWKNKHFHIRDIVHGKYLMENGMYEGSLRLLEKGYYKLQNQGLAYVSRSYLKKQINEKGFRLYRSELFDFINLLPSVGNKTLLEWVNETNLILEEKGYNKLQVNTGKAEVVIKGIFHKQEVSELPFNLGTIHSVKGQTFDAVLLFLRKKATKNYTNLLSSDYNELDESKRRKDKEELRLVYVACSRPKKLLWVAVPTSDLLVWKEYFGLNNEDEAV